MNEKQIYRVLDRTGIRPSKQLGQNFLTDESVSKWIVDQLQLDGDEAVVEVGPGAGSLTEHLLGKARHIILIEFDAKLAADLRQIYSDREDVEVHHADGAKFDRRFLFKHRRVKFLGNLPYSSGGAILRNLLGSPQPFERAVIMLQKEVIDRLGAQPGTKAYGLLSLRMQVDWEIEPLQVVPPEAFYPQPTIDSAVAVLTPRKFPKELTFDRKLFDELIRRGFSQRRKQLKKQLPSSENWESIAEQLSVSVSVRGEGLDLWKWIELTRLFDENPLSETAQRGEEVFDVVDEQDQVIGQDTRDAVHEKDLLHRAVHVLVQNKHGDIWLQKRSLRKDRCPGRWDCSVSGHLDSGETYKQAAVRELAEEVGIREIEQSDLIEVATDQPCKENGWEHIHLFEIQHKGALKFPAAEIEAMMPFPKEEIQLWAERSPEDFSPAFLRLFQKFIEHSERHADGNSE